MILVDGTASVLDAATRRLLEDLGVDFVYIGGGTGSVTPGIEASLRDLLGSENVHRFAGVDRFEVGVQISQEFLDRARSARRCSTFSSAQELPVRLVRP